MKNLGSRKNQKGFGLLELLIVLLVFAIIVVLLLPQIISSTPTVNFTGIQKQVTTALREARDEAMSQKKPITFQYNNIEKNIIIWGGNLGGAGAEGNRIIPIALGDLASDDWIYGRLQGISPPVLGDGSVFTPLSANKLEIIFQSDGSVFSENNAPRNSALFFYSPLNPADSAFAVSILGAGGRIKLWKYNKLEKLYTE